jgi:hypothetical protein
MQREWYSNSYKRIILLLRSWHSTSLDRPWLTLESNNFPLKWVLTSNAWYKHQGPTSAPTPSWIKTLIPLVGEPGKTLEVTISQWFRNIRDGDTTLLNWSTLGSNSCSLAKLNPKLICLLESLETWWVEVC